MLQLVQPRVEALPIHTAKKLNNIEIKLEEQANGKSEEMIQLQIGSQSPSDFHYPNLAHVANLLRLNERLIRFGE